MRQEPSFCKPPSVYSNCLHPIKAQTTVCTRARAHIHTHKRTHTHTHTRTPHARTHTHARAHTHTQTHTHTCCFLQLTGIHHRRNGFSTVQTVFSIALHLNNHNNPTPKPTPYRKLCAFLQKNVFCMIFKPFELWGH